MFNTMLLTGLCLSAMGQVVSDSVLHNPITETSVKLSEVVVTGLTGSQKLKQSPSPVSVIPHGQLEALPSSNIIDAIARQPGISQVTTGSGISKPVIRGLGYNRVVVVNNGVRQEGQQWGDEHGIEVDPYSVHSVEVLKGPASLMYGSDAMAGVIIFHPSPTLPAGDMRASAASGYQTNNGLFDYSLNFAGNKRGFVWNSRFSAKAVHSYRNHDDGYVFGSSFSERAISQLVGYNCRKGVARLTLGYYRLTPCLVEGARDEVTGELLAPDGYDPKGYGKAAPYQQVGHFTAVSDNSLFLGEGNLKILAGYQRNHRQEFEADDGAVECGLDFLLHTVNYDIHYLSAPMDGLMFSAGVNGMWQQSLNQGTEYLVPAYHLFDFGLFSTVSKVLDRLNLCGGLRFDRRHLSSEALEDEGELRFQSFTRDFDALTGSVGVTCELNNDLSLKLNVSRGFRVPNISELGSNGVHEGTMRYEIGNNDLDPEHSWQVDLGIDYTSPVVSAQLALFANRIDHYIFIRKMADSDGNDVLVDDIPAYRFAASDARILGGEVILDAHPLPRLHIGSSFSYVNSVQLCQPSESKYLPMTPAPRWCADVKYELVCGGRTFDNLFLKAALDCNLRQNHFYALNGTETMTPSYALLNLYAGTDVAIRGKRVASIFLSCENVTNRAYQSHLSRLKYLERNVVSGRTGVCNMGRNFCVKVVVPIAL